jgi:hypothetical protein
MKAVYEVARFEPLRLIGWRTVSGSRPASGSTDP